MFTPKELIRNTIRIRRGMQLARQCKKSGNQVIIVSNWDKESFELLKKKYHRFFTKWVDTVVISGADHIQETKPHKTIYQKVINHLKLDANNCYLIDDQKENIDSAHHHHKITGLHCPERKSIKKAKKFLKKEGVL